MLGFDEFAPGSQLQVDNARKCMNAYMNFLELGSRALALDCTWLVLCAVRHELMVKAGGWSRMLGMLLESVFIHRGGFSHGVVVLIKGVPCTIYAKLHNLVSDGDGLRMAYLWKGASGLKPCLRHWNVLKKSSEALTTRAPGYVEIGCHEYDKFKSRKAFDFRRSYAKVKGAHDAHRSRRMTQALHDQVCMCEGFNYVEDGMPYRTLLRSEWTPIFEAITVDWVHSTAQDGMLTVECFAILRAANQKCGHEYAEVESYLRDDWVFPQWLRNKYSRLHRVFSEYRMGRGSEEPTKLKANASECLGLYVLLRDFIETEVGDRPELVLERQSFDAACLVIDVIMKAKLHETSMADAAVELVNAMSDFMLKHKAAYGDALLKPKHHWLWDIVDQLLRDPFVLDALIIERLHLTIRRAAENIHNLRAFEASVLSRALNEQIKKLQQMTQSCMLYQPTPVSVGGFTDVLLGDNMQIIGMHVSVGDIIFCHEAAGKILACARQGDSFYCVVHELSHIGSTARHKSLWRLSTELRIWPALEVLQAACVVSWKGFLEPGCASLVCAASLVCCASLVCAASLHGMLRKLGCATRLCKLGMCSKLGMLCKLGVCRRVHLSLKAVAWQEEGDQFAVLRR